MFTHIFFCVLFLLISFFSLGVSQWYSIHTMMHYALVASFFVSMGMYAWHMHLFLKAWRLREIRNAIREHANQMS